MTHPSPQGLRHPLPTGNCQSILSHTPPSAENICAAAAGCGPACRELPVRARPPGLVGADRMHETPGGGARTAHSLDTPRLLCLPPRTQGPSLTSPGGSQVLCPSLICLCPALRLGEHPQSPRRLGTPNDLTTAVLGPRAVSAIAGIQSLPASPSLGIALDTSVGGMM